MFVSRLRRGYLWQRVIRSKVLQVTNSIVSKQLLLSSPVEFRLVSEIRKLASCSKLVSSKVTSVFRSNLILIASFSSSPRSRSRASFGGTWDGRYFLLCVRPESECHAAYFSLSSPDGPTSILRYSWPYSPSFAYVQSGDQINEKNSACG